MKIALASCVGNLKAATVDTALVASLTKLGHDVSSPAWNSVDILWHRFDAVVVRTTWDWYQDPGLFRSWIARVAMRTTLLNPPMTLQWGLDKLHLLDLAAAGVPVIPTLSMNTADVERVQQWAKYHGYQKLVLKPSLSAGAIGIEVIETAALNDRLPMNWPAYGVRLVQPYFKSIETIGELSIIMINGAVSHAVCKRPKSGDFRIQSEWGGRNIGMDPPASAVAVATAACAAMPGALLYARIDLVTDADGQYRVIEVEVVEPDLFFPQYPEAAETLAKAITSRLA